MTKRYRVEHLARRAGRTPIKAATRHDLHDALAELDAALTGIEGSPELVADPGHRCQSRGDDHRARCLSPHARVTEGDPMDTYDEWAGITKAIAVLTAYTEGDHGGLELALDTLREYAAEADQIEDGPDGMTLQAIGLMDLCGVLLAKLQHDTGQSPHDALREIAGRLPDSS